MENKLSKPYLWTYPEICQILDIAPKSHESFKSIKINKVWYYINESNENTLFVHYQKSQTDLKLIDQALEKGCLVITSMDVTNYPDDAKIIQVSSVLEAIQKLAKFNRLQFQGKLISVTGSVGKSSVKELTSQILSSFGSTFSILKNENGTLGINTILSHIPQESKFAILEVSASGPNSIKPRAEPIQANIGIVTNASYNHMIKYKDVNELRKEKLALLDYLTGEKIAIVSRKLFNEDLENENLLSKKELGRILTVGEDNNDDIQLISYKLSAINSSANIKVNHQIYYLNLPLPGKHFIETAMFSIAVAYALNLDIQTAINQCNNFIPPARRSQRFKIQTESKILELIDDSINASPTSVNALLDLMGIRKNIRRKVLIFGDMLELGSDQITEKLHLDLSDKIIDSGINYLITIGNNSQKIAKKLESKIKSDSFNTSSDAIESINSLLENGDLVAVKGSGAIKLNTIISKIKGTKDQSLPAKNWTIESENII